MTGQSTTLFRMAIFAAAAIMALACPRLIMGVTEFVGARCLEDRFQCIDKCLSGAQEVETGTCPGSGVRCTVLEVIDLIFFDQVCEDLDDLDAPTCTVSGGAQQEACDAKRWWCDCKSGDICGDYLCTCGGEGWTKVSIIDNADYCTDA